MRPVTPPPSATPAQNVRAHKPRAAEYQLRDEQPTPSKRSHTETSIHM